MMKKNAKCALVIIDAQARLMPAVKDPVPVSRTIQDLVKFANIMDIPVIVTEQQKLGDTLPEIQELVTDFQPISKISFSCFGCPDFVTAVKKSGADTLIIVGVEAHICVAQTALDAVSRYDVHVVADAISSRSPQNLAVALDRMGKEGVIITSKEMFFYEVLRKAGTPQFKEVLALVK